VSKIDGIKEELGWLKIVFAIFVATDVSLVGWVAQNFSIADRPTVVLAIIGILVITVVLVLVNRLAYRRIREVEKL
jgi:hypothetical protein